MKVISLLIVIILFAPMAYSQDNNGDLNKFDTAREQFFAQMDGGPPPDLPFPPDDQKFDQSRQKFLEQLRILKLLELLNLDENQDIEFMQLYRKHRNEVKENENEHNLIMAELSEGLKNESISDANIIRLTAEVEKNIDARIGLEKSFLNNSKKILSAEQFGKLVVFQERFERELLEQVRQFRNQERFGPGQGRGMGNGKQKTFEFGK
ncbi:MAG: hypothetical protein ABIJ12_08555 [bacterium]